MSSTVATVSGMYLENLVLDALDPMRVGRFWEALLGARTLTERPEVFETRLTVPDGPVLDLCFQRVPAREARAGLHPDLLGGARQQDVVDRAVGLGAAPADIGQGEVPWVVLADPEGNAFCVMEQRDAYTGTGPLAALPLDSADPQRDRELWAWLTGWVPVPGVEPPSLRHPSGRGPVLELCPWPEHAEAGKDAWHLDLRLEPGDDADAVAAGIAERGGREVDPGWGELPWRVFADASGNWFCLLPVPTS